ncbi:MAG: aquaporin family protein [Deltaproteobacteria bacterium]|nr:aquaporin family protein [Deltaproteobacteria bacterium]
MTISAARAYAAELLGTMLLLATIVGSGIMAQTLSPANMGVALLANAVATGGILYVLILGLGPISGAHMNPVITLIEAAFRRLPRERVPGYVIAQLIGACAGVVLAHAMFGLELVQHGTRARDSSGELISEVVAMFGLWLVIATSSRARPASVPAAVALYIVAAYWFTASTSFANPAVTLARSFTETFAGIRLADAPKFIAMQVIGGAAAAGLTAWLLNSGVHPDPAASSSTKETP